MRSAFLHKAVKSRRWHQQITTQESPGCECVRMVPGGHSEKVLNCLFCHANPSSHIQNELIQL